MQDATLDALNHRLALPGRLSFEAGPGGMPHALITAGDFRAEVALQGAHVIAYGRAGAPPILWASRLALYAPGKAIRGGIPICWPWFGPHPTDPARPAHGFARNRMWAAVGAAEGDGVVALTLRLSDDEVTRALWPHPFTLELTVGVGEALTLELTALNPGAEPITVGGALHSYFSVADVTRTSIIGLEGAAYLDQLTGLTHTQAGPVTIGAEVDRIYGATAATCTIVDPLLGRTISIAKEGSMTTVVWNPWVEKARRLADFADDEYPAMLCVETANAPGDTVTLAPGGRHTLSATIAAAPIG